MVHFLYSITRKLALHSNTSKKFVSQMHHENSASRIESTESQYGVDAMSFRQSSLPCYQTNQKLELTMSFTYSTLAGHQPRLPMFVTPLYQPYPLPPRSRRKRICNLTPLELKNMAEEMASLSEEECEHENEVSCDTENTRQELSDALSISSDKSFESMATASCSRSGKL